MRAGAITLVSFHDFVLSTQLQQSLTSAKEDGFHIFSIKDNGIGIEPQYYDRIFRIFQRLHSKEKFGGTGIGLSICRRIIERHGGRIWVESDQVNGSIFRYSIPVNHVF
ncbi:MAG TPA: ATP-binding protein [Bacteroidales bacterium]|nr:ATP-binding protein [Bacteroidales bacterium]